MRVIAGRARGMKLKTLEGLDTRPTTDRIKETLFNMLQMDVPESRFLDLFSGSGAIGIEALSRGAEEAVFVENNKKALEIIKENLAHTKQQDQAKVIGTDCISALRTLEGKKEFDIIFMDPPYGQALEKEILEYLAESALLDEDAIIIIESDLTTDFSYAEELGFTIKKEKKYKTNKHIFLCR